ncbi:MAG: hypothetical protein ACHREM_08635 [Polyangiales bacterium]
MTGLATDLVIQTLSRARAALASYDGRHPRLQAFRLIRSAAPDRSTELAALNAFVAAVGLEQVEQSTPEMDRAAFMRAIGVAILRRID